ncbi:gibberellin 2-beta-dioxygenase 1-like [Prosopis cineraria]|uniref:gibberellin 2-beta-dioxygenase 1-like n=1 Tax=Prosopis cineraria TaxID=364024 RepID=UPI00240EFA4B|nr:gibberellin 2-beta-dioxygenase 1-like [Prosopis cineraria]
MGRLPKPTKTEQHSCVNNNNPCKATKFSSGIPTIDLKIPEAKSLIAKACQDFGFFKLTNHGVPMEAIAELESQAFDFFSLPLTLKHKAGPPNPFGYGNKHIGPNGDVGWIEYLHLTTNLDYNSFRLSPVLRTNQEKFQRALSNYIPYVRKMACEVLELLAEGLMIQPRNVWSKMLMNEQSDSVFRLNHYPPCPELAGSNNGGNVVGFGEHTDPQIITVLRSNDASGLQVCLRDGTWVSVPPDPSSFFINVGDSLQVMSNGRLKSARHRVMANGLKSRVSMIYFGAPPLSERIAPLPSLTKQGNQQSLYKEFSWFEYKKSAYASRLSDNRLAPFERIPSS